MSIRRLTVTTLVALCTLGSGLVLATSPAGATIVHPYLYTMHGFGDPWHVAIGSAGETYVSTLAGDVDRFNAAGMPESFSAHEPYLEGSTLTGTGGGFRFEAPYGVAVNDTTGDIYVSIRGAAAGPGTPPYGQALDIFSATGEYISSITGTPAGALWSGPLLDPEGLAVNQTNGDVYLTDPLAHVVDVFAANGTYLSQLPDGPFGYSIAINQSTGDLYVGEEKTVKIYSATGNILSEWSGANSSQKFELPRVAVDPSNGNVYASSGETVDEFGDSTNEEFLGQTARTPTEQLQGISGIAIAPNSGDLYIATEGVTEAVDVFGPGVVVPTVVTGVATSVQFKSTTLTGTVNPENAGPASCRFLWGTSDKLENTAACSAELPNSGSPVPVEAKLSGLESDTTYYYRLQASNAKGMNANESGPIEYFTTPGAGIRGESSTNVAASSATLEGQVDPDGSSTWYYFQYGQGESYSADAPLLTEEAPRGVAIGSGRGFGSVVVHVQGLLASTTYHYRVVAVGEVAPGQFEAFYGPGLTFTTQAGGGELTLPDGREWEMVTPPSKEGALIYPLGSDLLETLNVQASSNGNAIVYMSNAPTEAEPQGDYWADDELATRGTGGWSTQVIISPHRQGTGVAIGEGSEYPFFSEDLSLGIDRVIGNFDQLSPEATEQTPYVRTLYERGNVNDHCTSECFKPLVTASNTPPGTEFGETEDGLCLEQAFCGPTFEGATPDLSHIVLFSWPMLTSAHVPGGGGLYEWSEGKLKLVNIRPADEGGVPERGWLAGQENEDAQRAISSDGSRIVWANEGALYLRDTQSEETTRLDLPQGGAGQSERPKMITADSNVSHIFFLDGGRLTANSGARGESEPDLYEYDLEAPMGSRLTDLTPSPGPGQAGDGQGVLGVSEDGSYVYYAAHGELFERHDGVSTAIAKPGDERDWGGLVDRTARVSPDGRWLAFQSPLDLTGYDTRDAVTGENDEEVYLYSGETHKLVCASCNPTGARPVGRKLEGGALVDADGAWEPSLGDAVSAVIPPWSRFRLGFAHYQSRYLSDSGRLFFDSNEALVPQDVNGTMDVYEYEPPAVGSCTTASVTFSERSGGCVGLISSGISPQESSFMDASETGGDVFFLTTAQLASQDVDSAYDIYDAHECSSREPCYPTTAAQPPACETSESCKVAETPQPPIFGAPSSETFSGAGNVTPIQPAPVVKRSLTRVQQLSKALAACRKKPARHKRMTCERQARGRYGSSASRHRAKQSSRDGSTGTGR